jgi:hypothetical protein
MQRSTRLLILLATFIGTASAELEAQTAPCHQPDSASAQIITYLDGIMSQDSAERHALRLPIATPAQISLVSDTAICARAGAVLDSVRIDSDPNQPSPPPSGAPLYVFTIS